MAKKRDPKPQPEAVEATITTHKTVQFRHFDVPRYACGTDLEKADSDDGEDSDVSYLLGVLSDHDLGRLCDAFREEVMALAAEQRLDMLKARL